MEQNEQLEIQPTCEEPQEQPTTDVQVPVAETTVPEETLAQECTAEEPEQERPAFEEPIVEEPVSEPMNAPHVPEPAPKTEIVPPVKAAKPPKRKPHIVLRMLMQILSFALCICLVACLMVSAVLVDVRMLTSSGSIQTIIKAYLSSSGNKDNTSADFVHKEQNYLFALDDYTPGDFELPDDFDIPDDIETPDDIEIPGGIELPGGFEIPDDIQIPDNIEIPSDIFTNPSALTDYIYEIVNEVAGDDVQITQEQVQEIVNNSTLTEFISDKAASYADDILSGTEMTTITTEEIMQLIDENQTLIEDTFQIEVTEEIKETIRTQVDVAIEENDLNGTIRQQITNVTEQPISENSDLTLGDIMLIIGQVTQNSVIAVCLGLCLFVILLLVVLNFYNLPMGLTWASLACLFIGGILSAPIVALQVNPTLLTTLMPEMAQWESLIGNTAGVFAPVHYGIAIFGFVLLVASIVWRIVAHNSRKERYAAA